MGKFFQTLKGKVVTVGTTVLVAAGTAMADPVNPLANVSINTDQPLQMAGIVLVGCGVMWGVRKMIGTSNKS